MNGLIGIIKEVNIEKGGAVFQHGETNYPFQEADFVGEFSALTNGRQATAQLTKKSGGLGVTDVKLAPETGFF